MTTSETVKRAKARHRVRAVEPAVAAGRPLAAFPPVIDTPVPLAAVEPPELS
jgi:hypothetical protein